MALPWFANILGFAPSYALLLAVACAIAAAGLLQGGALDAIQKSIVAKDDIKRTNAIVNGLRQGAMIAGAGLGGLSLMWLPIHVSFAVGCVLCVCVILCVLGLPDAHPSSSERKGYIAQMTEGYRFFLRQPELGRLAILIGLSVSVGQLSNMLLPVFVQRELVGGSELYGVIDALWSIGGIVAAVIVARLLQRFSLGGFEYLSIIALGALSIAVSLAFHSVSVAGLYFLMGFAFSFAKILCDGRMIELADLDSIGRVRTHTQAVTSAFGLVVFSMPAITGLESVRFHFALWGIGVVVIAAVIYLAAVLSGPGRMAIQQTTESDAHD
ncbi:UNVERIFIED_ORG: MFS family permease [Ensifer adhaerens]|nr:MFS family permease [Ensifer adhaerens]